MTGTGGGSGMSALNHGIDVQTAGQINAGGSGTVMVEGIGGTSTGNTNFGVLVTGADARITSFGGNVSVTGVEGGGSSSFGIFTQDGGITTNGGNITLIANSINIGSGVSTQPDNSVTLRPFTSGTQINMGSGTDPIGGPLGLSDTELDRITTGTLIIGDANSGTISISAPISRPALTNVQLRSGGDITFNQNLNTNGGTLLLAPGNASAAVKPTFTGTDATASTVSFASDLSIAINGTTPGNGTGSTYTRLTVAGSVDLTGVDLVFSGAYVPVGGNMFTIVDNDGTEAIIGTFNGLPEGAIIPNFRGSGFDARITYLGGDGNDVVITVCENATWYTDADGDGYGTGTGQQFCSNPGAGWAKRAGDCSDANAAINPGAIEICNNIDDDCDGQTDEGVIPTWFKDFDRDGYSDGITVVQCGRPSPGFKLATELTAISGDCDDEIAAINPNTTWRKDADNDGYSDGTILTQCARPQGYKLATELTSQALDCNDGNSNVNPGRQEVCGNNIDDNCNGSIDENCVVATCSNIVISVPRAALIWETVGGVTRGEIVVALNRPCSGPVSVDWKFANGTFVNPVNNATEGIDFRSGNGSLIFAPGETQKTIILEVLHDRLVEDYEFVNVMFSNPVNARTEFGRALIGSLDTYPCRSEATQTFTEGNNGNTMVGYTMKLNKPYPEAVSVAYNTLDNAAKAGQDYVAKSGVVTFAPEQTEATIMLEIIGDRIRETPQLEGFFLQLTQPNKLGCNGPLAYVAVFIQDDDAGQAAQPSMITYNLWPNPVQSQLNVQVAAPANEKLTMELVNAAGKTVKRVETVSHTKLGNTVTIGVGDLAQGLYKLVVTGKTFRESKSVIIQR
ncbi:MAG: T9SS C-terminal target domain-containing protein [Bacteroidetes bacterium]|nr:MAG: T9SS C-terminal target domain-containing protein [Bacteroidota bacterium]